MINPERIELTYDERFWRTFWWLMAGVARFLAFASAVFVIGMIARGYQGTRPAIACFVALHIMAFGAIFGWNRSDIESPFESENHGKR